MIGFFIGCAISVCKGLAVAKLAIDAVKMIANAFISLAKSLGLIKEETKAEDLGDKALQSEYDPNDFSSYEEYVKAVEAFDDLEPEKSKEFSEKEKLEKGIELVAGVTAEKYHNEFPVEKFLIEVGKNRDFFTDVKMEEIGKLIKADGQNVSDILKYLDGTEKDDLKLKEVEGKLIEIEKKVNPNISNMEAWKNVKELG